MGARLLRGVDRVARRTERTDDLGLPEGAAFGHIGNYSLPTGPEPFGSRQSTT